MAEVFGLFCLKSEMSMMAGDVLVWLVVRWFQTNGQTRWRCAHVPSIGESDVLSCRYVVVTLGITIDVIGPHFL